MTGADDGADGVSAEGDGVPELGDLARVHREAWLPRGRWRPVALAAVVAGGCALVAWVAYVVAQGEVWRLASLAGVAFVLLQPVGTGVDARGLDRRRGVLPTRRTPWADVVDVRPAGRWREWGYARLVDGRHLELVGMAPDDVVRLATALADARSRD